MCLRNKYQYPYCTAQVLVPVYRYRTWYFTSTVTIGITVLLFGTCTRYQYSTRTVLGSLLFRRNLTQNRKQNIDTSVHKIISLLNESSQEKRNPFAETK